MYKYRYKGNGTGTFYVDKERYEVSTIVPHLSNIVELKRKLTKEELDRIGILELVEDKKTKRGELI